MTLGEIVKQYRTEQAMSQRRFAELSGLSNSYISMLEQNMNSKTGLPIKPSLEAIKAISDTTGIPVDDIIRMMGDNEVDISGSSADDDLDTRIMRLVRQLPEALKLSLYDLLKVTVDGVTKR